MSRKEVQNEVNAYAFLHDKIPARICNEVPELRQLGIYRKLNSGKEEFVSYCKTEVEQYISFHQEAIKRMIDKYLPEKR